MSDNDKDKFGGVVVPYRHEWANSTRARPSKHRLTTWYPDVLRIMSDIYLFSETNIQWTFTQNVVKDLLHSGLIKTTGEHNTLFCVTPEGDAFYREFEVHLTLLDWTINPDPLRSWLPPPKGPRDMLNAWMDPLGQFSFWAVKR